MRGRGSFSEIHPIWKRGASLMKQPIHSGRRCLLFYFLSRNEVTGRVLGCCVQAKLQSLKYLFTSFLKHTSQNHFQNRIGYGYIDLGDFLKEIWSKVDRLVKISIDIQNILNLSKNNQLSFYRIILNNCMMSNYWVISKYWILSNYWVMRRCQIGVQFECREGSKSKVAFEGWNCHFLWKFIYITCILCEIIQKLDQMAWHLEIT